MTSEFPGLRLVVFDLGGTLVEDSGVVATCFERVLGEVGVRPSDEELDDIRGRSKRDAIGRLLARRGEHSSRTIDHVHEKFAATLAQAFVRDPPRTRKGAEGLLQALFRSGVTCTVTTGFTRSIADPVLRGKNWVPTFILDVITAEEVDESRPSPAMIHEAMRRSGLSSPAEVAKIGDTESDVLAGSAAGVRYNIALTGGAHSRQRLESSKASHVVDSLPEAMQILRRAYP